MAGVNAQTSPVVDRNKRVAIICGAVVLAMMAFAYASSPFYRAFTKATGYAGAVQRSPGNTNGVIDRLMTVRFDTNIATGLSWDVSSAQLTSGQVGTLTSVTFQVSNTSDQAVSATAILNVTPAIAGSYFKLIECFCFQEQTLGPGETAEFSLTYFLDPDLDNVFELDTVTDITLSQNFYASQNRKS